MIGIICGQKGKGKTKFLLEQANESAKTDNGFVVYLDKSTKHMFELDNKIRLINVKEYPVDDYNGLVGFVSGLLSGNHDIDNVYIDNFLKLSGLEDGNKEKIVEFINILEKLGGDSVNFNVSISLDKSELPEEVLDKVTVAC